MIRLAQATASTPGSSTNSCAERTSRHAWPMGTCAEHSPPPTVAARKRSATQLECKNFSAGTTPAFKRNWVGCAGGCISAIFLNGNQFSKADPLIFAQSPSTPLSPAVSVRELLGPTPQDWLQLHKCSAQTPGFHRVETSRGAHRHTSARTRAACSDTTHSPVAPVARHSPAVQEPCRHRTPVPPRLRPPATIRHCCIHASKLPK